MIRIALCIALSSLSAGALGHAAQDPSAAAEEIKAALGREMPAMVPIQQWNLPHDLGGFEIQDLYKHLHQAFMGPGHAIPSKEAVAAHLAAEWAELGSTELGEEPLELLVWGAPFVRVHLRPFRDRGGSVDSVLRGFLLSAEVPRDSAAFVSAWSEVGNAIAAGRLPFERAAFDSLDSVVRADGYPAVHHSARYRQTYHPAYRVLARQKAEELLQRLDRDSTGP